MMNYVLLIPKVSLKHKKELITTLRGFWNGIGYAFPPGTVAIIRSWFKDDSKYIIEVDWDGTWEEYREFCQEDWDYKQLLEAELENYLIRSGEGFYED